MYCGARYSELGRLLVGDFNQRASTIFISKSKSGKSRHIHLDPEARAFFAEVCAHRSHTDNIFLRDGEPWKKDDQKKAMRRACARAGIRKVGFHQLRHSAASRWIMLGVSLKVVAISWDIPAREWLTDFTGTSRRVMCRRYSARSQALAWTRRRTHSLAHS